MTDISELPLGRGSGVVVANEDDSVDVVGVTLGGSNQWKQAFGREAHVAVGSDAKHAGKDSILIMTLLREPVYFNPRKHCWPRRLCFSRVAKMHFHI